MTGGFVVDAGLVVGLVVVGRPVLPPIMPPPVTPPESCCANTMLPLVNVINRTADRVIERGLDITILLVLNRNGDGHNRDRHYSYIYVICG